jgi:hypothetical protein
MPHSIIFLLIFRKELYGPIVGSESQTPVVSQEEGEVLIHPEPEVKCKAIGCGLWQ